MQAFFELATAADCGAHFGAVERLDNMTMDAREGGAGFGKIAEAEDKSTAGEIVFTDELLPDLL